MSNLEIIVGTYEQFLLGYVVDNENKMEQSFATHSHLASIRSIARSKHFLASAAADDMICLYNMKSRIENGKLVHHTDTINSIAFTPDGSHLISVSSDGSIGIVRCGNWELEKHWLAPHKGLSVDTLAIHPTGKIAMTTGHDGVLRTWNLIKGRQAYATNLTSRWKSDAKNVSVLKWSTSGSRYLVSASNMIDIYAVESAGIEKEISLSARVVCAEFLNDDLVVIGLEDGKIILRDLLTDSTKVEIQAHKSRVKCLAIEGSILVTASSSGEIKLWSVETDTLKLLSTVSCNARISCICLTQKYSDSIKSKKDDDAVKSPEIAPKLSKKFRLRQEVVIEDDVSSDENDKVKEVAKQKKKKRKLTDVEKDTVELKDDVVESCPGKKSHKIDVTKKKKKLKIKAKKQTQASNSNETSRPKKKKMKSK